MKKIKYILFGIMTMLITMPVVFAAKTNDYTPYISCGNSAIPTPVPGIVRAIVALLQIVLPLVVIIMGSIDFMKAVASSDGEKIKNGQKQFIKRIVAMGIFFLVITFTKLAVSIAADTTESPIADCVDCLISDSSKCGDALKGNEGPFGTIGSEDDYND